jgi:hypothetical protein
LQAFQDHRQVQISRLPSDRANLSYHVDALTASQETLPDLCDRISNDIITYLENNASARAIVFTRYVAWAQYLAAKFSCGLYTGPADLEAKQADLANWLSTTATDVYKVRLLLYLEFRLFRFISISA